MAKMRWLAVAVLLLAGAAPLPQLAPLAVLAVEVPASRSASTRPVAPWLSVEVLERPEVPLRVFVARVDLRAKVRVRCLAGGDGPPATLGTSPYPTTLETVRHVADREHLDVAINGDFFGAEKAVDAEGKAALRQYVRGRRAIAVGNSVTDGVQWTRTGRLVPMLVVRKPAPGAASGSGAVEILMQKEIPEDADQVISGNVMLVHAGQVVPQVKDKETRHPRSAVGLSADGKTLLLIAVDGRSIRSRGATLPELAEIVRAAGAETALNLDGGGSTTLVVRSADGLVVENVPSDGDERPVANVLGVSGVGE